MNFDIPQSKPWENKKSIEFQKWLEWQIGLTPEKWSSDFLEYIEMENRKVGEKPSTEEDNSSTFDRYFSMLNLTEQKLKDKSVLDIGCLEGDFIISCIERGVTEKAYGCDRNLEGGALDEKYRGNFFSGDFEKDLTLKNMDYIISVGAISLYLSEEERNKVENMIAKAIDSINAEGEIRISPVLRALRGNELAGIKEEERVIFEILNNLKEKYNIEWELKAIDIGVSGIDKDVWAEQVLIIKHKKELNHEQIKIIEKMSISPNEKAELILVNSGLKSIAEIQIVGDTWESQKGEKPKQIDMGEIRKIKDEIEKAGFVVEAGNLEEEIIIKVEKDIPEEEIKPEDEVEQKRERINLYVAINHKNIRNYLDVVASGDDKKLGEIYGFPRSAIKAYQEEQKTGKPCLISRFNLPQEIKKQEESLFLTFMLAKDDIAGAIEVAKKWARKVKEISPEIYRQYIEYMRKIERF